MPSRHWVPALTLVNHFARMPRPLQETALEMAERHVREIATQFARQHETLKEIISEAGPGMSRDARTLLGEITDALHRAQERRDRYRLKADQTIKDAASAQDRFECTDT
jgi:ElaB/YqjD/DUF883 family membrane-anchored ribosome-binding protein